jgi:hypothetical protein
MAVLFALIPSAMERDACESYFSFGKPVRSSEASARSLERSAIPARRMPGDRWTCEMLFCCQYDDVLPLLAIPQKLINVQHTPKLASANKSDLNRLAAGFELGEFGREVCHGR